MGGNTPYNQREYTLAVGATSTEYTDEIGMDTLGQYGTVGFFSLELQLAGGGTADLFYEVSFDGVTWYTTVNIIQAGVPASYTTTLATGLTAGNSLYSLDPPIMPLIRFGLSETAGTPVTATIKLVAQ
jgi:hypothetical protein